MRSMSEYHPYIRLSDISPVVLLYFEIVVIQSFETFECQLPLFFGCGDSHSLGQLE